MDAQQKDEMLWKIARKRACFKSSLAVYLAVNIFLIAVWRFTSGDASYFWPAWPLLGWGIGIASQYFNAYHSHSFFSSEAEYEKLKKQNQL
jgi:hypothetical protein